MAESHTYAETRRRILVADDDRNVTIFFKRLLEDEGYQVDIVYNGKDAFRSANRVNYDLIHMDILMPDWDGIDAIVSIGSPNPEIPVLVVSGCLTEEVLEEIGRMPNVAGWIEKPMDIEKYLRKVSDILSKGK